MTTSTTSDLHFAIGGLALLSALGLLGCGNTVIDETASVGTGPSSEPLASPSRPSVMSTTPLDGATGAPTNGNASVSFDSPMDCASISNDTFTLTSDDGSVVRASVLCVGSRAELWPATLLPEHRSFTARVLSSARSAEGAAITEPHSWRFTTGTRFAAGITVDLGEAGDYAVLARTGISAQADAEVIGNVGLFPATSASMTGFGTVVDPSGGYSTSDLVSGKIYTSDDGASTSASLSRATTDVGFAFADAAARAPDAVDVVLEHLELAPGVARWSSSLSIDHDLTLDGDENDVWIFQVAGDLQISSTAHIHVTGGALASHVFWRVGAAVNLAPGAHLEGVVSASRDISLGAGASVVGRLYSSGAVHIDGGEVEQAPSPIFRQ